MAKWLVRGFICVLGVWYADTVMRRTDTLNGDSLKQLTAAAAFMDGRGFTFPEGSRSDLIKSTRHPAVTWPLTYPYLLNKLAASPQDLGWARSFLETAAVALFFGAWVTIFFFLGSLVSLYASSAVLIFWFFLQSPLVVRLSTDAMSLALLSAGIATCMVGLKSHSFSYLWGLLAGFFSVATLAFRFAYFPIPLGIGLSLWALKGKKRALFWGYITSSLFLFYFLRSSLESQTIHSYTFKVYWHQFINVYPFMADYLGLHNAFPKILSFLGGSNHHKLFFYWFFCLAFIGTAFWGMLKFRSQLKRVEVREKGAIYFFYYTSIFVSGLISAELAGLAFFFPLEDNVYKGFSTLTVPRYFGPVALFVFVYAAHGFFEVAKLQPSLVKKAVLIFLCTLASVVIGNGLLWNIYSNLKVRACGYYTPHLQYYQSQQDFNALLNWLRIRSFQEPGMHYLDEDPIRGSFLALSGAYCLPTPKFFSSRALPVVVIRSKEKTPPPSCIPYLKYGDHPRSAISLSELVRKVNGKEVLSSDSWVVYEGLVHSHELIEIAEKADCLLTPRT